MFSIVVDMSDEELRECLELAMRTNKILDLENNIFERYLSRHDPQSLVREFLLNYI